MADKDLIIGLVDRVARRTRANRLVKNITTSLSVVLVIPIAFKLVDLLKPFSSTTVGIFFGMWGVAALVYLVWRARSRPEDMVDVAANLDRKARQNDQLKTAYWFIRNPQKSPWVDVQIQRAAQHASRINLDTIFPRLVPRASYLAAGMAVVLAGMIFLPSKTNQARPNSPMAEGLKLTEKQRVLLDQTRSLLKKAQKESESNIGEQFANAMNDPDHSAVSLDGLIQQSKDLKQQLDEQQQHAEKIVLGLQQMAAALNQFQRLKPTAEAMNEANLEQAATEMQKAAEQMQAGSKQDNQKAGQVLDKASNNAVTELRELSKDMKDAAQSLQQQDTKSAKTALDKGAQELNQLAKTMNAQATLDEASKQLAELQKALGAGQPNTNPPSADAGNQAGDSDPSAKQGSNSGGSGPEDPDAEAGTGNNSNGQNPSGSGGHESPALYGAPTKLDVELKKEGLEGQLNPKGSQDDKRKGEQENIEQSSKQDRSKLDFRNVPSELTAAQKDLLNQDRIPWEYRELVKQYFQAIRPPENQQKR